MLRIWIFLLCCVPLADAEDWPRFRGPNGAGISESADLPTEFGSKKNLQWRVDAPMGRSSPIVVQNRIYLTGVDGDKLLIRAIDTQNGKTIWQRDLAREHIHKIYTGNDASTPTSTSDGENLYAFFPDLGLLSLDASGHERWRIRLGSFSSFYGVSSSPILHGNTVYLVCDQRTGSFVLAVDKDTGRTRWRADRKHISTEGFSSPVVYVPSKGKPQLIVTGSHRVDGYDLETGEILWWIGRQGIYPIGSPVLFEGMVIAVGEGGDTPEYPSFDAELKKLDTSQDGKLSREEFAKDPMFKDHFGWLDTDNDGFITREEWEQKLTESVSEHGVTGNLIDGSGDRTASNLVWRYQKTYSQLVTPLIYRDVLYLVKNGGIITSLNPKTGAVYKTGRTPEAIDQYFSSPVAADGKIFLLSYSGKVTVLKAGPQWEVLSVSDLDETSQATPAIAGGRIYIRTHKTLYSFGTNH